jgi:hypothetical protein
MLLGILGVDHLLFQILRLCVLGNPILFRVLLFSLLRKFIQLREVEQSSSAHAMFAMRANLRTETLNRANAPCADRDRRHRTSSPRASGQKTIYR